MSFLQEFLDSKPLGFGRDRDESDEDFARRLGWRLTDVAPPGYTPEERELLLAARELIERAWEGGHFSDLEKVGGLAALHLAAERAQELLGDDRVQIMARETAVGRRILVGVRGRT